MKKLLAVLLTIMLVVGVMPMGIFTITASAEISSGTCGENTYWEYDSSTRTLTISGNGSIKDYTTYYTMIHKKELTRAPWGSLYNDIQIVRINSGVTGIGTNAFYGFQKITTVYLANTVKTIGESAFLYCSSLKNAYYYGTSKEMDSIVIGQYNSSLTNVLYQTSEVIESGKCGDNLVWTLDSLNILTISGTGEMYDYKNNNPWYSKKNQEIFVIIEEGVTSIGAYAFYGCSGFKNIHISDDVTKIGEYAFRNSGFKNIQIPKSVTSIGMAAFRGCSANIEIPESITEMGSYAFSGCSGIKNVTIPNNVTTIGQCVFEGSGIESIDIENARISYAAFRDCSELESVNIRNCVDIGGYAFSNCPKLKNITIPDSVTDLGEYSFYKCSGLQRVRIGNGITEIGNSTFAECTALADITLGNGITKIGEYAFKNCRGIARTVILNDNLITIEHQAFVGCTGLLSITIPDSVTTIGISAFHGCVGLEDVSIGNGVKWIGCNAFAQCTALKKNNYDNAYYLGNQNNPYYYLLEASSSTKKIHNDTKIIGYGAFMEPDPYHYYLFDDLNSITIPFDVISIGDYAFTDCRNLESITIGNQVRLIGSGAFYGTKLKDIYYIGTSAQCDKLLNNLTSVDADCFEKPPTYHYYDCINDGHIYKNDIDTICYVCEFDKSLCIHSYEWIIDADATCDVNGFKHEECTICQAKRNENTVIPATGHTNEAIPAVAPTCTETGLTAGVKCSVCDEILTAQQVVPANGHNHKTVLTTAPTCTKTGLKTYTCTDCDDEYTEVVPANGHNHKAVLTTAPTCTKTGLKTYTCTDCDDEYTEVIPATGHTEETIPAVAPTCTTNGSTVGSKCSVCDTVLDAPEVVPALGHTEETIPAVAPTCTKTGLTEGVKCSVCGEILTEQQVILAKGHSYNSGVITTAPTCEGKGIKTFTCTVCGHSYTEDVAALGHTEETIPAVGSTCTETGLTEGKKCSVCDKVLVPQATVPCIPHDYKWVTDKEPTCYEVGLKHRECSVCQAHEDGSDNTMIAPTGNHTYAWVIDVKETCGADGTKHEACTTEGCTATRSVGTVIPATGNHTYTDNCDKTCNGCSTTRTAPHTYTSDYDTKCNQCGITRTCNTYTGTTGSLTYRIDPSDDGGNVTITKCATSASGALTIPASISNVPVTSIGASAFLRCTKITSVTIPDSVTSIGDEAFRSCSGLTSITIGNGVTSIGDNALSYCSKLTSITIPNSVTSIGDDAFRSCSGLTSVTIPDSVTSIGDDAFTYCSGLTSITIGSGVTSIGAQAFSVCSALTKVNITDLTTWCNIDFSDDTSNPLFYAKNLYLNNELITDLVIPNGVISIGAYAFYNCSGLTSITIPDSVTSIGDRAFTGCSKITKVNITDLAAWCKVELSESFYPHDLYLNNELITDLIIPDNITSIGSYTFRNCSGITSVTIPDSVTSIDVLAFNACQDLTSITVDNDNTYYSSQDGVLFNKTKTNLICYPAGRNATYTIPNGVTSIDTYAFYSCKGLTNITIPDSVTSIGNFAFASSTGLTNIAIGNGVTSIGPNAFAYCSGLISVIIPDNVTSIDHAAFNGCTGLKNITIGNGVTSIGDIAFNNCPELTNVYYRGSETQKGNITIGSSNSYLTEATWYYNSCIMSATHTEQILPAIAATCTTTGLTEGAKCTVCDNIITEQSVIPAKGHSYDSGVITTAPTCEEKGIKTFTCTVCGHSYTEDVAALGHTEETMTAVASTCTKTGLTDGKKCSVCGKILVAQETVPMIPHDYKWVTDKEATCNTSGIKHRECSVCLVHEDGSDNTMIAPTGDHKPVEIPAIAPTCTIEGATVGSKCSVCDTVLDDPDVVPALGHKPGEAVIENNVAPDCVNNGSYDSVVYCTVCNTETSRKTVDVSALGHTSETIPSVAPTCTETGLTEGAKCSVCGVTTTEQKVVSALGHKPAEAVVENNVNPDCVNDGSYDMASYCSVCNAETSRENITVPALGHSYDEGVITTAPTCEEKGIKTFTCTVCGHSYTEDVAELGHTEETIPAVAPTCTETGLTEGVKCSVCGEILTEQQVIPALGHKPAEAVIENNVAPDCVTNGSYDSVVYCTVCNTETSRKTIDVSALGHTSETIPSVAPTCMKTGLTEGTKCSVCGVIITQQKAVPALGHSYNSGVITTVPTCEGKGIKTVTCSVCGHSYTESVSALGHTETVIPAVAATCTETGLTAGVKCSVCGEILIAQQVISANGHTFKWVVAEDSTCGTNGSKYQECIICGGNGKTELIPATGNHIYSWITVLEPTCGTDGIQREECIVCEGKGNTQKLTATGNHIYNWVVSTAPTCSTAGSRYEDCINCNINGNVETIMPTGNHTYTNACDADCNICHTIRDTIRHTYTNKCDTGCNLCGATRVITHSYTTDITKASTLKNGSIVKKCTVCGSIVSRSTIRYAKTFKLSATSYTYNGKVKKPTVKVYDSIGFLISSSNYTVSYKNNKNVGKATVTIKFKGNYSGTKTLNFTINPKKTSISKVTAGKKSLKVSIKKQTKQVTGYEVQYSTSKKFTSAKKKTIKSYKTTSLTIKSLKAKKTYYVRVRTYKTINGKKYYSAWSTYKSKKTK